MKTKQIIIGQQDYEILSAYIKRTSPVNRFDRKNAASLQQELKKATIVKKEELPADVVRLDSRVVILDNKDRLFELALVLPDKADIKKQKISVFAPIGPH